MLLAKQLAATGHPAHSLTYPAAAAARKIGADLPEGDDELRAWEAEPVKVLLVHTGAFVSNKKGFPVLTKRHQAVVARFSKLNVQVALALGCLQRESRSRTPSFNHR